MNQFLSTGKVNSAINKVDAFINQVNGLFGAGKLDEGQRDFLLGESQAILDLLQAP